MVNPFDYLFYKVYKGLSFISGGGNPITHAAATVMLLTLNFIAFWTLFNGISPEPHIFGIVIVFGVMIIIYFTIRENKILARYDQESARSRTIGNTVVALYVILTFVFLIWVGAPEKSAV